MVCSNLLFIAHDVKNKVNAVKCGDGLKRNKRSEQQMSAGENSVPAIVKD